MDDILMNVNWLAVIAGTVVAFVLGMFWFGQIFGKAWSAGSHNIQKPEKVPVLGLSLQILGTFLMAWIIGATAVMEALGTAIVIILAIACLMTAGSLMSLKNTTAALIDGSYVVAMGVIMIAAQGLL
jgi:hypothetical protein